MHDEHHTMRAGMEAERDKAYAQRWIDQLITEMQRPSFNAGFEAGYKAALRKVSADSDREKDQ